MFHTHLGTMRTLEMLTRKPLMINWTMCCMIIYIPTGTYINDNLLIRTCAMISEKKDMLFALSLVRYQVQIENWINELEFGLNCYLSLFTIIVKVRERSTFSYPYINTRENLYTKLILCNLYTDTIISNLFFSY